MLLFESPSNPMLQVADISAICERARTHGVATALDNTFAGFHNHGRFDIDFFIHSLTKYANGHGDTMGGIVIGASDRIRTLKPLAVNMGPTLDPTAASQILRGMKTYYLRYRQHTENALAIAQYLAAHRKVLRVYYPGLTDDAGFELAQKQMEDSGGVLTFELDANKDATWKFIDSLQLAEVRESDVEIVELPYEGSGEREAEAEEPLPWGDGGEGDEDQ